MRRMRFHRRTMLRGLAGGALSAIALPTLDIMLNNHGTALAQGEPLPKRFGVFFWGNGVRLEHWTPSSTGAGYALTAELAGLAPVKDYVSVVSGMSIKSGNDRGHHAGTVGILSGAPLIAQEPNGAPYASTFSRPSIDQVVATELVAANTARGAAQTRFRSLELGVSRANISGEGSTLRYLSHNGPDNTNPPEHSPRAAFDRLFGTGFVPLGSEPVIDPRLALRRSVLDVVREDARVLRLKLGRTDQIRLDQHLDSIRALENQITALEMIEPPPNACMAASDPGDLGSDNLAAVNAAMSEILALSLACDQTRVFSVMFSGSVSVQVYRELGMTTEHHGLSHDEGADQPSVHAVTTFIIDQLGVVLERLMNTPEGDGNVLDNCAILASTDCAEGLPHSINDYPIVVAGRAGGALAHPGIHYRSTSDENTSNVLLTLVQAMGIEATEYGAEGGYTDQTVDALKS